MSDAAAPDGQYLVSIGDHAMGVELQIVELVERQARAMVQSRRVDAERCMEEIDELRAELASITEQALAGTDWSSAKPFPGTRRAGAI